MLFRSLEVMPSFLGGGMRHHFQPSVVDAMTFQSSFVTAYTPYQPEVSQGELQAMFEYQSMIAALTGLDVSNSSLYDGATGVAEAALLAMRQTNRSTVLISHGVHPEYRETLNTFLECVRAKMIPLELDGSLTPLPVVDPDVAAVIVQNPNFLGSLEDMKALARAAHDAGALFIAVVDPLSLAVVQCPADYGADIAVGDGQVIGNAPNFGGPAYGFIAVTEALMRQLPGRIVGATKDSDGRRGFANFSAPLRDARHWKKQMESAPRATWPSTVRTSSPSRLAWLTGCQLTALVDVSMTIHGRPAARPRVRSALKASSARGSVSRWSR